MCESVCVQVVCPSRLETDRDKKTVGAILLYVCVLVSSRQKSQLCVHSCNSSVDAATVCVASSVCVCVCVCVLVHTLVWSAEWGD